VFMPMDGFRGGWRLSAVITHLLIGLGFTLAFLAAVGYFSRTYVSRLALAYFLVLLAAGFAGIRIGARSLLSRRHEDGDVWRVLVMGGGRVAQEVAAKIRQHPEMLCRVVGLLFPADSADNLDVRASQPSTELAPIKIFDLLRDLRVNEVIIAMPHPFTADVRNAISRIRDMGIETSVVPQHYELYASMPNLIDLDGLPLLQLREPALRARYVSLKRLMDVSLSLLLAVPSLLVLTPGVLLLLLKKGSALRREKRIGQYGAPFQMLRLDVDRPAAGNQKLERFLERFSLTELPQLWNVLRGQMSLVGPRPESPRAASRYSEWQQRRLRVKPGMTGLAQVHGLREGSSSEEKSRFDLQYVMAPYILWDLSLLIQTIWTLALRLLPAENAGRVPERELQPVSPRITHAHSTQPSAD
jgi:lipopolysaccharide/colanic/teichoic acid biosynthesis glycosyltransferase